MSVWEIFLVGIGLSMDAFAASLSKGLHMKKINYNHMVIIALFFGGFQMIMPFAGWYLGQQFEEFIAQVDHWIAFFCLGYIGSKMIYESVKGEDEQLEFKNKMDYKELFILAIATSIDALAAGITFAFLKVSIYLAITIIGIVTFLLTLAGVKIGHRFGVKLKKKAEIAGGIILIIIGLKILLEHLKILKL